MALKYPVRDSANAGIPSELSTLKNSSVQPLRLRSKITISFFFNGSYCSFLRFQIFIPVSGSVSSRIFAAISLASASFAV